jgi:anti-sigma factor RsiW
MNIEKQIDDHVGELLSGYIDGELTQQDRQRVQLHCEKCSACQDELSQVRAIRERVGSARLSEIGQDKWRETMEDSTVKATRGIGWFIFIGGALLAAGIAVIEIISGTSMSPTEKLIVGGVYGGLFLLFISVLRQRLIERKTDKYKDVEI